MYELPPELLKDFSLTLIKWGNLADRINDLSRQQAQHMQRGVDDLRERRAEAEADLDERRQQIERATRDYQAAVQDIDNASDLNPGRVWARMDTPTQIMASLALAGQGFANIMMSTHEAALLIEWVQPGKDLTHYCQRFTASTRRA